MTAPPSRITENFTLGRGRAYLAILDQTTKQRTGVRYFLGEMPELNISADEETIEYFTNLEGLRNKVMEIPYMYDVTFSGQLDEMAQQNLELLYSTTKATVSQAADTDVAFSIASTTKGSGYDLGKKVISNFVCAGLDAFDEGDANDPKDYIIDYDLGILWISLDGAIPDATALTGTIDCADVDEVEMAVNEAGDTLYSFIYQGTGPVGQNYRWEVPACRFKAGGDTSLVTEGNNHQQLPFTGTSQKLADEPVMKIIKRAA
jgi:hypothetical protein